MTTFLELKTGLAADLRDTSTTQAFGDDELGDLINAALYEVGVLAPLQYTENLTVTDALLVYPLRAAVFAVPSPEIHLTRVEVWDTSVYPSAFVRRLNPAASEYVNQSDAGWRVWNGSLEITNAMEAALTVGTHVIRTWGLSPFKPLLADATVTDAPAHLLWPVRECAAAHASERLLNDRQLFQQWATSTHNTDLSPAALVGILGSKRANWERRRRQLHVMREGA